MNAIEGKVWFCVINRTTQRIEGRYSTVKRARSKVDRVDNEYGGYIARIEARDDFNNPIDYKTRIERGIIC